MKCIYVFFALCLFFFTGCEKDQYAYKKFINDNEIIYAGLAENLVGWSGNLRVRLEWKPSIDPTVTSYIVYWNNNRDSATVSAASIGANGLYHYTVSGLPEYVQSFKIVTINDRGYRSIGQTINGVRVFGPLYESSLNNKQLLVNSVPFRILTNDSVRLYLTKSDTTNIYTKVYYYKLDNTMDSVFTSKDSVTLASYKLGTKAAIRSYFKPMITAVDTFRTRAADSTIQISFTPYTDTALRYTYRATGTRYNYNSDGTLAGTAAIDLDKQIDKIDYISVRTDDIANLANFADTRMVLMFNQDGTIDVSGYVSISGPIVNHPTAGKSYIDRATGALIMRYKYTNADGSYRLTEEIWRRK